MTAAGSRRIFAPYCAVLNPKQAYRPAIDPRVVRQRVVWFVLTAAGILQWGVAAYLHVVVIPRLDNSVRLHEQMQAVGSTKIRTEPERHGWETSFVFNRHVQDVLDLRTSRSRRTTLVWSGAVMLLLAAGLGCRPKGAGGVLDAIEAPRI